MAAIPAEHGERARAALQAIVTAQGVATLSNPAQMISWLSDLMPDAPGVARMLVAAAEEHVAGQLRDHVGNGLDGATATSLVAASFADKALYAPEACTWIVAEIAIALGLADDDGHPLTVTAPPPVPAGPDQGLVAPPPNRQPPRLALPVGAIDFGHVAGDCQSPERRVHIGNAGGGSLNPRFAASASWLHLRQAGGELVVTIDTSEPGERYGTVAVHTDGGSATIPVRALVMPAFGVAGVAHPVGGFQSPASGQPWARDLQRNAAQNLPGATTGRQPLNTWKHIMVAALSGLGILVYPIGLIVLPGALVATYLDRPLRRRTASRTLIGYSIFAFVVSSLIQVLVHTTTAGNSIKAIIEAICLLVGAGYLTAGLRMRETITKR